MAQLELSRAGLSWAVREECSLCHLGCPSRTRVTICRGGQGATELGLKVP